MLIGQTDMFRTVTALGLRGRVGDQWNMCTFHQGSEKMILQLEAGYKRAVDSSAILFLQNRRGPYKRRSFVKIVLRFMCYVLRNKRIKS